MKPIRSILSSIPFHDSNGKRS
uniref:Uncharacterized protein n=1 Tax=Arundo donax TaxID=35708 RepID=A0A0A9E948_ARUDO